MRLNTMEGYIKEAIFEPSDVCRDKYIQLLILLKEEQESAKVKAQEADGGDIDRCMYHSLKLDSFLERLETVLVKSPDRASSDCKFEIKCFSKHCSQVENADL